jgi:hypothetical protein
MRTPGCCVSDLLGDRFCVVAVVVNLTGTGNCTRQDAWPEAGLSTALLARKWDLANLSGERLLDEVDAKRIPQVALAWFPVMQGGEDPGMMGRWRSLAGQETDPERLADLGLTRVFAEVADREDLWKPALESWAVIESKVVKEWQKEAALEGLQEAR